MTSESFFFFFSSRRRHTICSRDWSSDVCSSDLKNTLGDDFRRRARRSRADIRHEIADGEINLVADRRNDRHGRLKNRARHGFFVERPKVFKTPAAARDEDEIQSAALE